MTILTRKREEVLDRLIELAGDPLIVQRALAELNAELEQAPSLELVALRILKLKDEKDSANAA